MLSAYEVWRENLHSTSLGFRGNDGLKATFA